MNDGSVRGGGGLPESGRPDSGPETLGLGAAGPPTRRRRQRTDAQQSIAAILEAATDVLNVDVGASIEDIARAAGVTRQTVYAHFPSRQALLNAVIERAVATVTAAFDAAGEEEAPPAVALTRLLDTGMRAAARYAFLWQLPEVSVEEDRDRHQPVMERMLAIIERGQETGDIDATLSPAWLLTAALALGRAAEDEVKVGRMTAAEAGDAVRHSCLRLFGITDPA
ncbi:MAG TPA: TetR/AcrR family transcriptional regulator [Trebonia sp.]